MTGYALANYAGDGYGGGSVAFDGVAYRDGRPRDIRIAQASNTATILRARFDLKMLRDYRRREVWGDAYRRPEVYGPLVGGSAIGNDDPGNRRRRQRDSRGGGC